MPMRPLAFIALGANLGDARKTVSTAMERLERLSDEPLLRSSLWESEPVDCPPGSPKFVNAVAGLVPKEGETAKSLLAKLQVLEREFGRQTKKVHNEARPLDLDLIVFGSEIYSGSRLTLPHPRAHVRRFVLQPLTQIAPDFVLPGQTRTVRQLLDALPIAPACRPVQD
jgi:2-amino-4-hydroxy-6-hydroxymethyldihydropteridine diphosphokinase